jgi:hypothetical protein
MASAKNHRLTNASGCIAQVQSHQIRRLLDLFAELYVDAEEEKGLELYTGLGFN